MISEADARAWIAAYGEAWTGRDPDRIVKLFTADAIYRERRFQPPRIGISAIRNYWEVLVFEGQRDVYFAVEQLLVAADQAFVNWTAHFTWRPTNGIIELDGFARITFADERPDGLQLACSFEEWIDNRQT